MRDFELTLHLTHSKNTKKNQQKTKKKKYQICLVVHLDHNMQTLNVIFFYSFFQSNLSTNDSQTSTEGWFVAPYCITERKKEKEHKKERKSESLIF